MLQKRRLITYPAIPKVDKNILLASALPPRSLKEKQDQPQFVILGRSGRHLRTIYGATVKVVMLHFDNEFILYFIHSVGTTIENMRVNSIE